MRGDTAVARLSEVADLNPRLGTSPDDDELVSFLPMSALEVNSVDVMDTEQRQYAEVSKGYTSFVSDDVLVAKITPCFENGKIAQAKLTRRVGYGSTEFHVVRPHPKKLDARYLVHFLRQTRVRFEGALRMTGSAGQRRIPEHYLASLSVPLPPLAEQRRIAEILDKADALRAKRRAALAHLEALVQSIFLDMFGDPVTNSKAWKRVTMAGAVTGKHGIKAGPFGSSLRKDDYSTRGYRVYGQEQVIAGRFDVGDYYIGERKYQQLQSCAVADGDLLVSLVGSFGRVLIVPSDIEPGIINPRLLKIRPNQELVIPDFLAALLQHTTVQAEFRRVAHGGTMGILNAGLLKQLNVILPPLHMQREFARRLAKIDQLKGAYHASLAEMDGLFTSLQQRAFCGEL